MLVRFEVENFRSLAEPTELTMVALDRERPEVRASGLPNQGIVPVAGIFGPNASGKSNVLAALGWLREAMRTSLRLWDESIPIEPFAFRSSQSAPTSFAIEMTVEGVLFEYLLELDSRQVLFEALFHYPEGRRRKIFRRVGRELSLQRGLGHLAGVRPQLTDRSLVLSILRRFDDELISSFTGALLNVVSLGEPLNRFKRWGGLALEATMSVFDRHDEEQLPLFDDDYIAHPLRSRAMALLQVADLGISDVEIERVSGDERRRRRPRLIHRSGRGSQSLEFTQESAGTQSWFNLVGPLLVALDRGALVLFDELEANLHPVLSQRIVELFLSSESNPRGAQLLFTSHDTNLLNILNRDEVWLTQKEDSGITRFGALSDFAGERVRRSRNIEVGYLSGRFGALPQVEKPEWLRELGLLA